MSSSLVPTTLKHTIPDDFEIPRSRSRPWEALKILQNYPYILTADEFGAAAILWSLEKDGPKVVTKLTPPLSPTAHFLNKKSVIVSATRGVFVLLFHESKGKKGPVDVAQTYSLTSGELVQRLEFGFEAVWDSPIVSEDTIILTAKEHDRRPKVVYYRVTAAGLENVKEIVTDLPDGKTAGMERLVPLHLEDEGSLLTSSTSYPSNKLDLRLLDQQATVTAAHTPADYIAPAHVIKVGNSVALAVTEAEFDRELSPAYTTVHMLSLPGLAKQWSRSILHKVVEVTYHPELNALVLLGWKANTGSLGEQHSHMVIVTFLDVREGRILAERSFTSESGEHSLTVKCTTRDELVVVSETGDISISPLKSVLETGLPLTENGLLEMRPSPVRPEPYNTKATKAGSNWKWVKRVVVGPGVLVLFALRGPEFYVVRW